MLQHSVCEWNWFEPLAHSFLYSHIIALLLEYWSLISHIAVALTFYTPPFLLFFSMVTIYSRCSFIRILLLCSFTFYTVKYPSHKWSSIFFLLLHSFIRICLFHSLLFYYIYFLYSCHTLGVLDWSREIPVLMCAGVDCAPSRGSLLLHIFYIVSD